MALPVTSAEYSQVTITLDPQAMCVILVLPGRPARTIWLADDRQTAEYEGLSDRDRAVARALLDQARAEIAVAQRTADRGHD